MSNMATKMFSIRIDVKLLKRIKALTTPAPGLYTPTIKNVVERALTESLPQQELERELNPIVEQTRAQLLAKRGLHRETDAKKHGKRTGRKR